MQLSFESKVSYRDRIYIVKDILLKLLEYGELNQTSLVSYCGLNLKKHRGIFDEMEKKGLINRYEISLGKRSVTIYRPSKKGIEFCRMILEPYEKMFPRSKDELERSKDPLLGNKTKPESDSVWQEGS